MDGGVPGVPGHGGTSGAVAVGWGLIVGARIQAVCGFEAGVDGDWVDVVVPGSCAAGWAGS